MDAGDRLCAARPLTRAVSNSEICAVMKIGYLVHNLNDPAVERRCQMLERGGAAVAVAGFLRDEHVRADIAMRNPLVVGRTRDADFAGRAFGAVRVAASSQALRRHFKNCDVLLARNLEQLAIVRTMARGRPVIYECLDLHRLLLGTSVASRVIRALEASLLPHVKLLLTSSPAFLREHFDNRPFRGKAVLLENKLLSYDGMRFAQPTAAGPPWRIGWFGMLRCRQTFNFLAELASHSEGEIEVLISGKPSSAEFPDFVESVEAAPNMQYTGPYQYNDLIGLYGQCHFAWAIDWFEEGFNSSWLLPNRIYESLAHGTVPIALASVEAGRWLRSRGVGLVVDSADQARSALTAIQRSDYEIWVQQLDRLPREDVVADDRDCVRLVDTIESVCK